MKIISHKDRVIAEAERLSAIKLTRATLLVERTAKQLCPVKTGTLKRSVFHKIEKTIAYVGSNVSYAPFVEMGTRKWSGKPFLRPALEANRTEIERLFNSK